MRIGPEGKGNEGVDETRKSRSVAVAFYEQDRTACCCFLVQQESLLCA